MGVLEEELAELNISYAKKEKLADLEFLYSVLDILNVYYNLQVYQAINSVYTDFNKIIIGKGSLGGFSSYTKNIYLDLDCYKSFIKEVMEYNEKYYLINLKIMQGLYHEVLHAFQFFNSNNNPNSLENALILSNFNYLDKVNKSRLIEIFYQRFLYYLSPIERLAYIDAYKLIFKVNRVIESKDESVNLNFTGWFTYMDNTYLYFNNFMAPTEAFIKLTNYEYWKKLPFYSDNKEILLNNLYNMLTTHEIMRLGLPINKEDKKLVLKIKKERSEKNGFKTII